MASTFPDVLRVGLDLTPLLGNPTGIHQHTRALLEALQRRDDLIVSGWLLTGRRVRPETSVTIHRRIPAGLVARSWARGTWPGPHRLAGPVDVVHGTNFLAPPTLRSVVTIQDTTPLDSPHLTRHEVAAKAAAIARILRSPALVHATSQAVADRLVGEHGVAPDRVSVVHLALSAPTATAGAARPAPGFARYAVVVGTTEPRKRVPAVVETMAHLPDELALVIVGPEGADEPAVQAARTRLVRPERVIRIREADDATRAAIVAGAAVSVTASSDEGFGFPPLEALAVGVPAVATAVGALPELLPELVLIDPATPRLVGELAERVRAEIERPVPETVRARLSAMTWDRHASEMTELYRRAASA